MMVLFKPEFGLIFWMFIVFLIILGILTKYAWPVIIRSIEERAAFIDSGVEYTREAERQMEETKGNVQLLLADAHRKQLEILQETERLKQGLLEEAKKSASMEARKVMDAAQLSIEQSKREAELQFRKEVSLVSLSIAEKLLRKDLSGEPSQVEMIEKLLDEMKK